MTSAIGSKLPALCEPVPANHSSAVRALFERTFQSTLRPTLAQPDRVFERIGQDRYYTRLFFSDPRMENISALFSIDKSPFTYKEIDGSMRVHFAHAAQPGLRRPLLAKAIDYAISKQAKAILFFVPPAAKNLDQFLGELKFSELNDKKDYKVMIHRDPTQLKAELDKPVEPARREAPTSTPAVARTRSRRPVPIPIPGSAPPAPPAPCRTVSAAAPSTGQAVPQTWKAATLMKKYLHMIRDGRKPVEGRINRGMFSERGLHSGMGMRFFYQQNANDDVQCEITNVRTFTTFREMLEHYGWQKCVPDARSFEHAVSIYANIPGYARKERESGVIGIELKVLGHGPEGPYHRRPQQLEHRRPENGKRRYNDRDDDYDHRSKSAHYNQSSSYNRRDRHDKDRY